MPLALLGVLAASHLVLAAADKVPQFDTAPSCKAAAAVQVMPNRDSNACERDEATAKEQLVKQWKDFPADERARCTRLSHLGGGPSYVELLTCLDMAKAAANIPDDQKLKPRVGR